MNTPDTIHFTKEENDKRYASYADALRIEMLDALDRLIASVEAGDLTGSDESPAYPEGMCEMVDAALGCPEWHCEVALANDGSVDEALSLKDALLPGCWIADMDTTGFARVYMDEREVSHSHDALCPGEIARALLLATLKAYRHTVAEGQG